MLSLHNNNNINNNDNNNDDDNDNDDDNNNDDDDDNNSNNNNNNTTTTTTTANNNRIERCNILTAPRTVSNMFTQVAEAQSCANHMQHVSRPLRAIYRVPRGTKGQLSY